MNFLDYDFVASDLLTAEEEKKLEDHGAVSFRGRGTKKERKQRKKKTEEKKLEETVFVPEPQPAVVDDRTPQELQEHSLAQDALLLRKWNGWELITPAQLTDLKVGTWIVQTKFINWKVKQRRSLCMCRITQKSDTSLSFENIKPRTPNPAYPFVHRTWTLSWTNDQDRDTKLVGSSFRNFYRKPTR
jgi:hypothetical protein